MGDLFARYEEYVRTGGTLRLDVFLNKLRKERDEEWKSGDTNVENVDMYCHGKVFVSPETKTHVMTQARTMGFIEASSMIDDIVEFQVSIDSPKELSLFLKKRYVSSMCKEQMRQNVWRVLDHLETIALEDTSKEVCTFAELVVLSVNQISNPDKKAEKLVVFVGQTNPEDRHPTRLFTSDEMKKRMVNLQ